MGVVRSGFAMAKPAQSLDDRILRFGLAGVDDVVDFGDIAEVGMGFLGVGVVGRRGNPAVVGVGIAIELAIGEITAQEAELPHVVGDVFADVANGAVGADDDFLVFFGN